MLTPELVSWCQRVACARADLSRESAALARQLARRTLAEVEAAITSTRGDITVSQARLIRLEREASELRRLGAGRM